MVDAIESMTPSTPSTDSQYDLYQELLFKSDQSSNITGSTIYQLEMKAAMDNLTSTTHEVQKQAKENAEESGEQAPTIPTF